MRTSFHVGMGPGPGGTGWYRRVHARVNARIAQRLQTDARNFRGALYNVASEFNYYAQCARRGGGRRPGNEANTMYVQGIAPCAPPRAPFTHY